MAIDPWEINTPSGWQSIELYDPGTFDIEPIEIYTAQGWKVPFFHTNASDADTPIELYTQSNGWVGLNTVGVEIIDDFEDGNRTGWTVPSSSGSDTVTSSGYDGSSFRWQHSGPREGHLAGADAVDRGPQPGDQFEVWFQIESDNGNSVINRFEFSADSTSDGDKYRVEFERNTSDTELSLEKFTSGSQALLDTDENFVPSIGQTYRLQIDWNNGNNNITVQAFLPNGNTASTAVTITDDSSAAGAEFTQPGIYCQTNGNNTCSWDEIKITP